MSNYNGFRVFTIIREHADDRNVRIFQSWASNVPQNPAGQLCPDARDIAQLVGKLNHAERIRTKAEIALDKFFMLEAEAKAEAIERVMKAKTKADTEAERIKTKARV